MLLPSSIKERLLQQPPFQSIQFLKQLNYQPQRESLWFKIVHLLRSHLLHSFQSSHLLIRSTHRLNYKERSHLTSKSEEQLLKTTGNPGKLPSQMNINQLQQHLWKKGSKYLMLIKIPWKYTKLKEAMLSTVMKMVMPVAISSLILLATMEVRNRKSTKLGGALKHHHTQLWVRLQHQDWMVMSIGRWTINSREVTRTKTTKSSIRLRPAWKLSRLCMSPMVASIQASAIIHRPLVVMPRIQHSKTGGTVVAPK